MYKFTRIFSDWYERIFIAMHPSGRAWQNHCALVLAGKVMSRNAKNDEYSGSTLYAALPSDMAPSLVRTAIDPYNRYYDKQDLYRWISDHVVFDGAGQIVGLHDNGDVLIAQEGYEGGVIRYARFKKATTKVG